MAGKKLAEGIISITLQGLGLAQTQLAALQDRFSKMSGSISTLSGMAAKGFAGMTGGILGLLAAADPVRFQYFQVAITALAIQVGKIFIPVLIQATVWLLQLGVIIEQLTPEMKTNILHWVELVGGILGAVAAVGLAAKAISVLGTVISAVGALLSAAGPIGAILGIVGAITGLIAVMDRLGVSTKVFGMFEGPLTKIAGFGQTLIDAFQPIITAAEKLYDTVAPIVSELVDDLFEVIGVAGQVVAPILAIWSAIQSINIGVFDLLITALHTVYELLKAVVGAVWDAFGPTIIDVINGVKDAVQAIVDVIQGLIGAAKELLTDLSDALGLGSDKGGAVAAGGGVAAGLAAGAAKAKPGGGPQPLPQIIKPEFLGVEEAFKKANTAGAEDPNKLLTDIRNGNLTQVQVLKMIAEKIGAKGVPPLLGA